jgi:hypothetical protein
MADPVPARLVFTGTKLGGAPDAGRTASDWYSDAPGCAVTVGLAVDGSSSWYSRRSDPCDPNYRAHLFCFEVGRSTPLAHPTAPPSARSSFVSGTLWDPSAGIPSADQICATEARMASKAGTFLALLASTTATATSRFDLAGQPWVRADGVLVVEKAGDLASGKLLAPILLGADGRPPTGVFGVWTGADLPGMVATQDNCRDWSSSSATDWAIEGATTLSGLDAFSNGKRRCDTVGLTGIYCFQQ